MLLMKPFSKPYTMKKLATLVRFAAVLILLATGCKKKNEADDQLQSVNDQMAVNAVNAAFNEVLPQINFTSRGNVDMTINSQAGGNAHITGTMSYSETTQRTDWFLSIGWWSYKVNGASGSYTLNGLMECNGYSNAQGAFSSNYSSGGGISIKGTYNGISLDYSCPFSFKVQYLASQLTISGDICGRSL
jgi:hypothetical protein